MTHTSRVGAKFLLGLWYLGVGTEMKYDRALFSAYEWTGEAANERPVTPIHWHTSGIFLELKSQVRF